MGSNLCLKISLAPLELNASCVENRQLVAYQGPHGIYPGQGFVRVQKGFDTVIRIHNSQAITRTAVLCESIVPNHRRRRLSKTVLSVAMCHHNKFSKSLLGGMDTSPISRLIWASPTD
jgi:hypothetical protein